MVGARAGGAQDFKTAHLLGVCPRQQFGAMLIGSGASVLVSVGAYQLYTSTYQVGGVRLWHRCTAIKSPNSPLTLSSMLLASAVGNARNPTETSCHFVQIERRECPAVPSLLCRRIHAWRRHVSVPHKSAPHGKLNSACSLPVSLCESQYGPCFSSRRFHGATRVT